MINRLWVVVFLVALYPQVETTFGGDEDAMIAAAAGAAVWASWVVNLLVVEWWLERDRSRRATAVTTGRGR